MKPSIQKLQKFFRLEAERGYDNRAVLGGLENIVDGWESEARVDQLPEDLIQTVRDRLHDYAHLSSTSRAEALEGIWRRIQRRGEAPPSASPAQETRPAQPETPPAENREISIEEQFEDQERSRTISEHLPEEAISPESAPLPSEPVDTNIKAESEYPKHPIWFQFHPGR
jgi:ATP-dependent DNA helicase RecG